MLGKAFNDGGFAFFDKVDDLFWGEFFAHHDIWQDKIAAALVISAPVRLFSLNNHPLLTLWTF